MDGTSAHKEMLGMGNDFARRQCPLSGVYRKDDILIGQSIILRYEVKNQTEACEGPQEDAHRESFVIINMIEVHLSRSYL